MILHEQPVVPAGSEVAIRGRVEVMSHTLKNLRAVVNATRHTAA